MDNNCHASRMLVSPERRREIARMGALARGAGRITILGVPGTVRDWSTVAGCSPKALRTRLRHGWHPLAAVVIPVSYRGNAARYMRRDDNGRWLGIGRCA